MIYPAVTLQQGQDCVFKCLDAFQQFIVGHWFRRSPLEWAARFLTSKFRGADTKS